MKSLLLCLLLSLSAFGQSAPAAPADIKNDNTTASQPIPLKFDVSYIEGPDSQITLSSYQFTAAAHSRPHYVGEVALEREGWIYGLKEVDHPSIGEQNAQVAFTNATPDDKNLQLTVTNPGRGDILCQGREETLVRFGGGRPWWPNLDGFGYHVRKGDHLKVDIRVDNPKNVPLNDGSLNVVMYFQPIDSGANRQDVYPLWFDTKGCGPSEYDLKPGKNIASGSFEISVDGNIVALQGALRKFGQQLVVSNVTHDEELLNTTTNPPVLAKPANNLDWHLAKGDFVSISASYDNPEKRDLKIAATGIALGLFVPSDPAAVESLNKHKVEDARPRASQ
jgi:hypothetical protein